MKRVVTRKQIQEVVRYANAWCDEYLNERPFKLKDFTRLIEIASAAECLLNAWNIAETQDLDWDQDETFRHLHDAIHSGEVKVINSRP